MSCRTGCKSKRCGSYAECLRTATLRVAYTNSANGYDYTKQKKWDGELDRFRTMEAAGLNPLGTTHREMDRTERKLDQFEKVSGVIDQGSFD